jgi:septal ring factor EnvC (AmiA/AmiB activator)
MLDDRETLVAQLEAEARIWPQSPLERLLLAAAAALTKVQAERDEWERSYKHVCDELNRRDTDVNNCAEWLAEARQRAEQAEAERDAAQQEEEELTRLLAKAAKVVSELEG